MKRFGFMLSVVLAAGLFATAAPAQGLYSPKSTAYNWTGFYVGGNGGFATTNVDDMKLRGGLLGATIGANFQADRSPFVFGVEGDWGKSWVKGTHSETFLGDTLTVKEQADSLATLRARVGLANGPLFIYATGGVARAPVSAKVTETIMGVTTTGKLETTVTGAVAGAGIEYALDNHWSVKGEYLFARFSPNGDTFNVNVARAGVNYKF